MFTQLCVELLVCGLSSDVINKVWIHCSLLAGRSVSLDQNNIHRFIALLMPTEDLRLKGHHVILYNKLIFLGILQYMLSP